MGLILNNDFSAGLCPGDDSFNGRKNALLRMDNLCLDDQGAVELTRGTALIGIAGVSPLLFIYSKYLGADKWRFVHQSGVVSASKDNFASGVTILTGGNVNHATFGQGLGQTFISSGTKKQKFDGSVVTNWGIKAPASAAGVATGAAGLLTGTYTYIQVNVNELTSYAAVSSAGPISATVSPATQQVVITPYTTGLDPQVTHLYFYRIGGGLDAYYFVGKMAIGSGATYNDNLADSSALLINIKLNQFLASVADIPDEILSIAGPFNGRMLLLTFKSLIISDLIDPDAYDTRMVITLSGNVGEKNLFVSKTDSNVVRVGTTADVYELTGTLALLPDGTFDVYLKGYGINQPPINGTSETVNNEMYYVAADCIRFISGSSTNPLTNDLDWFFKGVPRYGASPFIIKGNDSVSYRLEIYKNKLFFLVYTQDGQASVYVYDLTRKYWFHYAMSPASLFTEEDGTLIGGYTDGTMRQLDINYFYDTQFSLQSFYLRTTFSKDLPLQRKDTFALKVWFDSWGSLCDFWLVDNDGLPVFLGAAASNGIAETVFPLNTTTLNLKKRFYLVITDHQQLGPGFLFNTAHLNTRLFDSGNRYQGVRFFRMVNWSIDYEERPTPLPFLRIAPTQFGIAGRKRLSEIPFVIDTLNSPVSVQPVLDSAVSSIKSITTTNRKKTNYLFDREVYATDIGLLLTAAPGQVFEFYEMLPPKVIEALPDSVQFYRIPSNNLGTPSRKRISHYAFVINTFGAPVTFTPFIDGVAYPSSTVISADKSTYIYSFISDTVGTDIWGTLKGNVPFEFYDLNLSECIFEKLPPATAFLRLPPTNLATGGRKRISTIGLILDTKGNQVKFTPYVDDINYPPFVFISNGKRTVLYNFKDDVVGIDLWGTLESIGTQRTSVLFNTQLLNSRLFNEGIETPVVFEYYGIDLEESVTEKIPIQQTFLRIQATNFGIAAKKRVRTVPFVINTLGSDVQVTPIVDGVLGDTQIVNTQSKITSFYYFLVDSFGVDYGLLLSSANGTFEFYEILTPEDVETLPVGKKFDQIGPVEFEKSGRLLEFRFRCVATGSQINYTVYMNDSVATTGSFAVTPNIDKTYAVKMPQGIIGNVCRVEFRDAANLVFYRWKCQLRVNLGGMKTEMKLFNL